MVTCVATVARLVEFVWTNFSLFKVSVVHSNRTNIGSCFRDEYDVFILAKINGISYMCRSGEGGSCLILYFSNDS